MDYPIKVEIYQPINDGWVIAGEYSDNEEALALMVVRKTKELHPEKRLRIVRVIEMFID